MITCRATCISSWGWCALPVSVARRSRNLPQTSHSLTAIRYSPAPSTKVEVVCRWKAKESFVGCSRTTMKVAGISASSWRSLRGRRYSSRTTSIWHRESWACAKAILYRSPASTNGIPKEEEFTGHTTTQTIVIRLAGSNTRGRFTSSWSITAHTEATIR